MTDTGQALLDAFRAYEEARGRMTEVVAAKATVAAAEAAAALGEPEPQGTAAARKLVADEAAIAALVQGLEQVLEPRADAYRAALVVHARERWKQTTQELQAKQAELDELTQSYQRQALKLRADLDSLHSRARIRKMRLDEFSTMALDRLRLQALKEAAA